MPISVLPTTPTFNPSPSFEPPDYSPNNYSIPNGSSHPSSSNPPPPPPSHSHPTIAEIKEHAKETILKETKGASALALLKAARTQYMVAGTCESQGDLRGALSAFIKAASLVKMVLESAEFVGEGRGNSLGSNGGAKGGGGGGGVVRKEVKDFMERDSINLKHRMSAVEDKLRTLEKSSGTSSSTPTTTDGPISKPGGSIADRMRALQDSGLSISTTSKRFSTTTVASPSANGSSTSSTTPTTPSTTTTSSSIPSMSSSSSDAPSLSALSLSFTSSFPSSSSSSSPSSSSPLPALNALSALSALTPPSHIPGSSATSYISAPGSSTASSTTGSAIPPGSSSSSSSSPHAFVSPSTLGPPSPTSSPSTSPTLQHASLPLEHASLPSYSTPSQSSFPSTDRPLSDRTVPDRSFSVSDFNTNFPSIDELDERDGTAGSANSIPAIVPMPIASPTSHSSAHAHTALRNFIVPVERPSSTPLTPLGRSFTGSGGSQGSRPGSPSPSSTLRKKSSGLSTSASINGDGDGLALASAAGPSSTSSSAGTNTNTTKQPLPIPQKNACTPRELHGYLREHKVLLMDVRSREEFERGHVQGAVVCIEPGLLKREYVTSDTLSDAFVLSPSSEASTFNNRHKFDLVVLYDARSTSFGPPESEMNRLIRAIWEREFDVRKVLRRMPMLLVGGWEAWRAEFGAADSTGSTLNGVPTAGTAMNGIISATGTSANGVNGISPHGTGSSQPGSGSRRSPASAPAPLMSPSLSSSGRNPFAPGGPLASPGIASSGSSTTGAGPSYSNSTSGSGSGAGLRSRAGTNPVLPSSYTSGPGAGAGGGHRSNYSLDQGGHGHSRSPAESNTGTSRTPLSPDLSGGGGYLRRSGALAGRTPFSSSISSSASASASSSSLPHSIAENAVSSGPTSPTILNGATPITYPSFASTSSSSTSSSSTSRGPASPYSPYANGEIASPPLASINPTLSRRRSDYVDQSREALGNSSLSAGMGSLGMAGSGMGMAGMGAMATRQPSIDYLTNRPPIDYPELSSAHQLRPPPAAASSALERQDNHLRTTGRIGTPTSSYPSPGVGSPGPGVGPPYVSGALPNGTAYPSSGVGSPYGMSNGAPGLGAGALKLMDAPAPRIRGGEWPARYWADSPIGTSGLKNLGNTCYMNAPIQCLSATAPFARFFTEVDLKSVINYTNKMNSQGQLTRGFAKLIHDLWHGDMPYLTPTDFRRTLCSLNKQYVGTDQHDSQEFLSFLLDGIHEDLNRIMLKKTITRTPEEEERLEHLPQQVASDQEWQLWKQSNDSIIVDYFQGQFRNQLRCLTCQKTSTTYNAFSILSLPIPGGARSGKVPLQSCLKAFFNVETMEGDDAWDCPRCKVKRRATKTLSLARLPPILVIHLKRFEANGRFSDKVDTFVDFPVKSLDLTELMPPPLPAGADHSLLNGGVPMSRDDPRTQVPPYRYDLYGVTNHYGNLSSGHYTAFVASRGGWLYCDDSSVKNVDSKQVSNQKAYVLFYKRTKA